MVDTAGAQPSPRLARRRHSRPWVFGTMLVSALISLTAALVLSIDAVALARDPETNLACDINSVISCGTVGLAWQSQLFGFPNSFLGLIAEPVVITVAVAGLGGVRFPRWFMAAAQTVYLFGVVFAYWLFAQSLLVIHALCPWCLLVTLSTTTVFVSLLHWNVLEDNLYLPRGLQRRALAWVAADADVYVTAAWIVLLVALVVLRYGSSLFG